MQPAVNFVNEAHGLTTTSRVMVKWWQWRGYRVVKASSVPHLGWFGQVRYRKTWHLAL